MVDPVSYVTTATTNQILWLQELRYSQQLLVQIKTLPAHSFQYNAKDRRLQHLLQPVSWGNIRDISVNIDHARHNAVQESREYLTVLQTAQQDQASISSRLV